MYLSNEVMKENAIKRLKNSPNLAQFKNDNGVGFDVDITTLTGIKAQVTGQKFYQVKPSEFLPVVVGENAFMDELLTYKDFSVGEDFSAGLIEPGSNRQRLSEVDVEIASVTVPIKKWAKMISYNLMELAQATKSGNWSLVEAKEKSRVKNWQLGIQKLAFLGLSGVTAVDGLLTQTDVTSNTSIITKKISLMTSTEFQNFLAGFISAYHTNSNSTAYPDTFVIPSDDFNGLATAVDETFPLTNRLERITSTLRIISMNPSAKVMPLAYAQQAQNAGFINGATGYNRYVLYRANDSESLRMDIPNDYTTTIFDTIEGFHYSSAAYGSFTGAKAYRPKEMLYFDWAV